MNDRRAELTRRIRETKLIGGDLCDIITKGSPAMGWEGDPFLMVCWNKELNRIEIWDERNGPGNETLVGSAPFDPPPNPYQMVQYLLMRDMSRKSIDEIVKEIDDHNDAIVRSNEKERQDKLEEAKDRVALAAHKEIFGFKSRVY
jgi:hypothetical protein